MNIALNHKFRGIRLWNDPDFKPSPAVPYVDYWSIESVRAHARGHRFILVRCHSGERISMACGKFVRRAVAA